MTERTFVATHPSHGEAVESASDRGAARPQHEPAENEVLDQTAVAELSATQIDRMTSQELIHVIRVAQTLLPQPDVVARLQYFDRPMLEQMAFLARRCCRNVTR